jgi:glycosyltransferase involved in cell wall biosynthesis
VAQPNSGLGTARNTGIRLGRGEFILLVDSDNRVRDAYLNESASVLKDNPILDLIYADAEYCGDGMVGGRYRNSLCCRWSVQTS